MKEPVFGQRCHLLIEQEEANQPRRVRQNKKQADEQDVQGIDLNRQVIAQVESKNVRKDRNADQSSESCQHCGLFEHFCSQLRSEEHTSELQSQSNLVCRLLLEKNK